MNATTKFYTGFTIVLAIIIAVSFAVGYRAGYGHAIHAQTLYVHSHMAPHGTIDP